MIANNPEALYEFLAGDEDDEDYDMEGMMGGGGEGGGPGGMPSHVIELTEAEAQAVRRLETLGFDHQTVLHAYIVCDKNEELAANYLFDHPEEDAPGN